LNPKPTIHFLSKALIFFCSFYLIKKNEKIKPKQSYPPTLKKTMKTQAK